MRPLGRNQIKCLISCACPNMLLIVGDDKVSRSLVKRGFLASGDGDDSFAFLRITPAGLRALADAWDAAACTPFIKSVDDIKSAARASK